MKKFYYSIILLALSPLFIHAQNSGFLKGKVSDKTNQEELIGALITIDKTKGVATDLAGNYYMQLEAGSHQLTCDLLGYSKYSSTITIKENDTLFLNITMGNANQLLDEVVVSAGKFEQKLSDVTVSMDIIKPALIQNKGTTSLDIVMNQVPGVVVSDGQASIRGGSGYSYGAGTRVLMLVDEMPFITADAADIKWNYLPLENLEQVEVIKGAASALFGSSALNGVINMRTAYAKDKPQTMVSMFGAGYDAPKRAELKWWKGSSQKQYGMNFSHAEKIKNWDIVLGGHVYKDEGYRYLETEDRARFNANVRYNFKKIHGLSAGINTNMMTTTGGLFFLWQHADSAYIPYGHTIQTFNNKRFNIDPFITYFTKQGGKFSIRSRYFLSNNVNSTNQGSRAELYYNEFQYQKRFKNSLTTTLGAVYTEQQVMAPSLYGRHTGQNYAGYAQFDYKYKKLTTSFGLRGEYYKLDTAYTRGYISKNIKNLPFQPVFRAGLNYHAFEFTFIRASFGQGYRFPSIAEKYINTGLSALKIFPNESIQPERGWSAEIGIKQGFKILDFKGFLDVAAFWTEYQNMIEFIFDIYGTKTGVFYLDSKNAGFKSQNVGRARINGIDASITGTGKLGPINVNTLLGYTFTNPIAPNYNPLTDTLGSLPNSNLLKYRNRHLIKGDIQFDYKKVSVGYSVRYYSFMENIDKRFVQSIYHEYSDPNINWDEIDGSYILPGLPKYRAEHNKGDWVHDVRLAYQLTERFRTSLIVNNVLNTEYTLRPGDVRPPRMFMLQVVLKM